jgi:predicted metal-binding membrane protein
MVLAMMLPATLPTVRAVSLRSMWDRRYQAPAIFLSAYILIWAAVGAIALAAWRIAGFQHSVNPAAAAGVMLVVGAVWQLTPQHNRFLKRCHRTLPLGARGYAADRACVRYGAYHGRQCVGSCWPLMLVMIPGHYLPELMVTLAALSTWERLALRPRRRACAAGLAGLAALTLLAGA